MAKANADDALRRTIRRHQLREMIPLADSTIYEMEQRGEFPRRFALSPRCIVWDLAEVEAWLLARRADALSSRTFQSVKRGQSKGGIKLHQRHSRRQEPGCVFTSRHPRVNDVRLFPLDRTGRFRRNIVDHAVDAAHLVDDAGGGAAEEFHVVVVEIGRHAVDGGDGA